MPTIHADFKNGAYEIDGTPSSLGAIFEENTDWQDFNSGMISAGVGLVLSGTNNAAGPKVVDALAADFLTGGVTVVAQVNLYAEGASPSNFTAEMVDLPDFNAEYIVGVQRLTGSYVSTPSDLAETDPSGAGPHKVAMTIAPDGVSVSIDGQTAITAAYAGAFEPNALCFSIARGAIESLTLLAPVSAGDLPSLSV